MRVDYEVVGRYFEDIW